MENSGEDDLRQASIDSVIWQQGDDYGRADTRRLNIIFTDRVSAYDDLIANKDQTEYASVLLPEAWEEHGIEEVRVTVEQKRSVIFIRVKGKAEPLIQTREY